MSSRTSVEILLRALAGSFSGIAAGLLLRSPLLSAPDGAGTGTTRRPPDFPHAGPKFSRTAQARLDALLAASTPSARLAAALTLGELDSVDDIRALLKNWRRFPDDASEHTAKAALLKRWLELDAAGSLEYCRLREAEFLPGLIAAWSGDHPKEAESWVLKLPPGDAREKLWSRLCLAAAEKDPAQAWRMLARTDNVNFRSSDNEYSHAAAAIGKLVSQDPEPAIRALDSMPPRLMAAARNAIATQLAKTDPDRAWVWARQQPNQEDTTVAVLSEPLRSNPAKALELMRTLSPEELQKTLGGESRMWVTGSTEDLVELLKKETGLDEKSRQKLAAKAFQSEGWANSPLLIPLLNEADMPKLIGGKLDSMLQLRDPKEASAWANALPEGPARTAALDFLARHVTSPETGEKTNSASSPAELQNWVVPEAGDPRVSQLTESQLAGIISGLPPDSFWKASHLLANLSTENPAAATAWLEHTPLDSKTGPLAAEFSVRWSENDPATAAAWVKTLPPGPLAETAAFNVARQYQRYAPGEAAAWLGALPAGPVQDAARKAIAVP
ncbi:MAG: hypothetical protein V4726_18660 [Verrucomicrobiota bacterium]